MGFQDNPNVIQWRIHLKASPENVFGFLSTDEGRARFWAESVSEADGYIRFNFPDGQTWQGRILTVQPNRVFKVEYYGGSITTFELTPDSTGGTEVTLTDEGVEPVDRCEVIAGWVSVLLAMKAAVDYSVDVRNHDRQRTWNTGYADN